MNALQQEGNENGQAFMEQLSLARELSPTK